MEYSFTRNDLNYPVARLNMEAEAFAHWLNIEMSRTNDAQLQKIAIAVTELLQGRGWQYDFSGREFHLELSRQQAIVSANAILEQRESDDIEEREFEEQYDDEFSDDYEESELTDGAAGLTASCGLEDFNILILAWIEYKNG
jgi:uncharacterized protein YacL (UPF0231 family)